MWNYSRYLQHYSGHCGQVCEILFYGLIFRSFKVYTWFYMFSLRTRQTEQSLSCLKFQTLLTPLVSALHVVGRLCRRRLLVGWLIWLVKGTQTRWLCKFSHVTKLIRDEGSVFGLSDHLHSQIFCSFYCYATEASPEMTLEDYSVILEGTATDQAAILDMWGSENDMIICGVYLMKM